MAKKKTKRSSTKKGSEFAWHFIVPSVIGGCVAWFFSGSMELAVIILFAVLIGNYIGYELVKKYR